MPEPERPRARVVVIGSANMDIVGHVPRLPAPGETVLGDSLRHAPGGKGANQAVAAARAGSETAFVGRVGNDAYGEALQGSLEASGVELDAVIVDPDLPTGVALILVDEAGDNSIAVIPGANGHVAPSDVDRLQPGLSARDVVVLQLEIPLDTVEYAANRAHAVGARVILNPAPALPLEPDIIRLSDVLVPNATELRRLTGVGEPLEPASAARMLIDVGARAVVVTLGKEGAVLVTDKDELALPALTAETVDTTGAGDAFVGNLAHCLAAGEYLTDAVRFALAAASLSVERYGAQASMPSGRETGKRLRKGKDAS